MIPTIPAVGFILIRHATDDRDAAPWRRAFNPPTWSGPYTMSHGLYRFEFALFGANPSEQNFLRRAKLPADLPSGSECGAVLPIRGRLFERQIRSAHTGTIDLSVKSSLQRFADLIEREFNASMERPLIVRRVLGLVIPQFEASFTQITNPPARNWRRSDYRMNNPSILTINGGSSSIKFALYQVGDPLKRGLHGKIDRVGMSGTNLTFEDPSTNQQESPKLAPDGKSAGSFLMDWLEEQKGFESVQAVGHRVVHGMQHTAPSLVTPELLNELHRISPCDPDHLPREIELIEAVASVILNYPR